MDHVPAEIPCFLRMVVAPKTNSPLQRSNLMSSAADLLLYNERRVIAIAVADLRRRHRGVFSALALTALLYRCVLDEPAYVRSSHAALLKEIAQFVCAAYCNAQAGATVDEYVAFGDDKIM